MTPRFPIARFLLSRVVSGDALESITGDLDEEYALHIRPTRGRFRAWLWYWRLTLRSIVDRRTPRERRRPATGGPRVSMLRQHLTYATRTLRGTPAATGIAIATIALGIGASATVFSVVNTALFRPLPYGEADQLVMIWDTNPSRGFPTMGPTPANLLDWRDRSRSFADLVALAPFTATVTGRGEPRRVEGQRVGWRVFDVLQTPPLLGRAFREDEDVPGNDVAIISHRLWTEALGSDAGVIGQRITVNSRARTIVGVMPAGFRLPPLSWTAGQVDDVWVPLALTAEERRRRGSHYLSVIGRLGPGVSLASARQEMDGIAAQLAAEHPQMNAGLGILLRPMRAQFTADLAAPMRIFAAATGLLLLIACLNVANLQVGRSTTRRRELSVRAALGASRRQLIGQLMTEGAVLASLGGALGILLAVAALPLLAAQAPIGLLPVDPVALDWRVALFALGVIGIVALGCGIAPLFQLGRLSGPAALYEGARTPGSASGRRFRGALVVAQIALACVLLVSAGLLVRSFVRLVSVDPGFHADQALTLRVDLPRGRYRGPAEWTTFFDEATDRMRALPGVEAVGAISWLPLTTGGNSNAVRVEHQPPPAPGEAVYANYRLVTPEYFEAIGLPVRDGRPFTRADRDGTTRVVAVNETMAARYWPGERAVGKRVTFRTTDPDESSWLTIVAVVGDAKQGALSDPVALEMYAPFMQEPNWFPPSDFVIRTSGDPLAIAPAVRRALWSIDDALPITRVQTMDRVLAGSVAEPRFMLVLVGFFAVTALTLAAIGIYGLMSFAVAQRTREIGVRTALGARPGTVLALVLRQGLGLTLAGALIGSAGALAAARLLEAQLFEVEPTDPLTFGVVVTGLAVTALVACYVPGRRALRIEPTVALRVE